VPRTDGEAIVTPEHPVADRGSELLLDVTLVLNRQVRDATARIELIRRRERARGADIETPLAGAAVVLLRRTGWQRGRREDGAEKQPGAVLTRNEVCMLAQPREPRSRRERLFHQRRRIHEDLHVLPRPTG